MYKVNVYIVYAVNIQQCFDYKRVVIKKSFDILKYLLIYWVVIVIVVVTVPTAAVVAVAIAAVIVIV